MKQSKVGRFTHADAAIFGNWSAMADPTKLLENDMAGDMVFSEADHEQAIQKFEFFLSWSAAVPLAMPPNGYFFITLIS